MRCIFLFGLAAALAACSQHNGLPPTEPSLGAVSTAAPRAVLVSDFSSWPTDPLDFLEVGFTGDTLVATVSYGGGCREHEFALVIADLFRESHPVQTSGLLSHDARGDLCRALITRTLRFDLSPLRDAYHGAYGANSRTIVLQGNWPGLWSYRF